jgi:ABC-type uncharacterized transport system substrate-binding protein
LGWSSEKPKVGILHSADEARYLQTAEGALKQLKAEGFDDGKISVDTQSAKGDKAAAAKIAKQFAVDGAKVILTMGTNATGVTFKELRAKTIAILAAILLIAGGTNTFVLLQYFSS